MRFAIAVACAVLLSAVGSQSPLPAQWPGGGGWGANGGGYPGPALGPYGSVHAYAVGEEEPAPFGAVAASSRTRVTVGPGGGFHAVNTKSVTRVGPEGTSSMEARRVA